MGEKAIRVSGLGKEYQIGTRERGYTTFREAVARAVTAPFRRLRRLSGRSEEGGSFWALKDVSFEVEPGEVVGIIGRNGAGKSTLLKVLSQITEPTEGEITLNGRVGSLLEVGTGFHPELTGRENIYLNGAILGMSRREVARKFDEIVAFSEVEQFLDTPVKRYSSGMYMRLAFSVAAHLEPEILIVDEVLAVGDAQFQQKCIGKMGEVAKGGRTVLFVSHNMAAVQNLCARCVLLEKSRVVYNGAVTAGIARYMESLTGGTEQPLADRTDRKGSGKLRLSAAKVVNSQSQSSNVVRMGDNWEFELLYTGEGRPIIAELAIVIATMTGIRIARVMSSETGGGLRGLANGVTVRARLNAVNLIPGRYGITFGLRDLAGEQLDNVSNAITVDVVAADVYGTGKLSDAQVSQTLCYFTCDWALQFPESGA